MGEKKQKLKTQKEIKKMFKDMGLGSESKRDEFKRWENISPTHEPDKITKTIWDSSHST